MTSFGSSAAADVAVATAPSVSVLLELRKERRVRGDDKGAVNASDLEVAAARATANKAAL